MVLRSGGTGVETLLMRRAEREGDPWSGHMAFPGGRHDPSDETLMVTAVREAREEVGLDLATDATLLGELPEIPVWAYGKPTDLYVSSFVFELHRGAPWAASAEVAELLWVDLAPLARGEGLTQVPWTWEGKQIPLPGFDIGGRVVWGLTYRMLASFFEALAAPP
ncbi:MAG: CoA pyrophosphatase [Polyangiaceae bacterium]|nr:CoA pyrophosphatase [Polyangiaceae bacterium]